MGRRTWGAILALLLSMVLVSGCLSDKETEVSFGTLDEVMEAFIDCLDEAGDEDDTQLRAKLIDMCERVFNRAIAYKEAVLENPPGPGNKPYNVKIEQHGLKVELTDAEGQVLLKLGETLAPLAGAGRVLEQVPPVPQTTPPRLEQRSARGVLRSDRAQHFFFGRAQVRAGGSPVGQFFILPLESQQGEDGWYTHQVTFWPAPDWAAYATGGAPLEMSIMVDVGVETDQVPLAVQVVEIFEVGGVMVPFATFSFTLNPEQQVLLNERTLVDSGSLEEAIMAYNAPLTGRRWYFRDVPGTPHEAAFNLLGRLGVYRGYP
ncbi:MAG TPA: hypothetical protein VD902_10700, partial [Symbiobacteriaceae bacterium]|nr:hypothetical protein [Symbiobacteriaceae bacterium]